MKIDIVADTICPWCYIGKVRLDRALEMRPQSNLTVGWRAFQLNPDMPSAGIDRRDYVREKFGGPDRAKAVYGSLSRAGSEEGIEFNFQIIETTPNTIHSHRLVRHAATYELQTPVVTAIYEAYFQKGQNIGDIEILADIGESVGIDRSKTLQFLESDADTETVVAEDELARKLGVTGVPCFIVNRKYAVSGAQSAEVLVQVFDLANQDEIAKQ
ncbi:MAG: DsbA family oxidoreductase [Pseudomonadota bacterium]|nr:DsbA family oxidoreductase [Pseudomonadota bacterium]